MLFCAPLTLLLAGVMQIAYAAWPPGQGRSMAGAPHGGKRRGDHAGWPSLPADILLHIAALVTDADVHVMACASASWRDALNRDIHSMSFTWAARDPRHGHVCAVCAPACLSSCISQRLGACSASCAASPVDDQAWQQESRCCFLLRGLKVGMPAGERCSAGSCCDVHKPAHCGAAPRNPSAGRGSRGPRSRKRAPPEGTQGLRHHPRHAVSPCVLSALTSPSSAIRSCRAPCCHAS